LLSYGTDRVDLFRRAATYVDRILRGAKLCDLPVQFPTKFEMVLNLKTAKALGLAVPQSILLRADDVIGQATFCRAYGRFWPVRFSRIARRGVLTPKM
jgi:ABC-type uncharacterized transport system substrate-binding protein